MMDKWYNAKTALPKENGEYLCISTFSMHQSYEICGWTDCLQDIDKHDFKGIKRGGWYMYDSEYGFYEMTNITHWMPLPKLPEE